jgi:hypothetical protein
MTWCGPLAALFCLGVGAAAQAREGREPPTLIEQQKMLAHLDDYLRHPPDFVCTQQTVDVNGTEAVQASRQLRSIVTVYLRPAGPKPGGIATGMAVEPLLRELLSPGLDFRRGWALVGREMVAVYRYRRQSDGGLQGASIYADHSSGLISKIVFEGFNRPEHQPISCRAESSGR